MKRLTNKVSIITGTAQGIGLAIATKFANEGAIVVVYDQTQAAVDEAVSRCRALGAVAAGFVADVTQRNMVDVAVESTMAQFGHIDVLVNNAGISQDTYLENLTAEQFDRLIDLNLRGVFHCTQAVSEHMVAQGKGVILNTSSVVGAVGKFGQNNYAASKSGVIGFTKTWCRELGPKGIRVNAVAPGFIDSTGLAALPPKVIEEMIQRVPLRRLGEAAEIANVYAFLASDEASYVNGAVLEVSGGTTV